MQTSPYVSSLPYGVTVAISTSVMASLLRLGEGKGERREGGREGREKGREEKGGRNSS